MKNKSILIFGAGKSSDYLIEYLKQTSKQLEIPLFIVDSNLKLAQEKLSNFFLGKALSFDVSNEAERNKYISQATVVISLLPVNLHILIARSCITFKKSLFTASYIDDETKKLAAEVSQSNILFLYELGLDPGIDHLSAVKLINELQSNGAKITSFKSHCGGLLKPQPLVNPWHYKISWNPKNIVLAGRNGAIYLENDKTVQLSYLEVFSHSKILEINSLHQYSYYANRNSLLYINDYRLNECKTFIRTTLRHPEFCQAWFHLVAMNLTSTEKKYYLQSFSASKWLQNNFDNYINKSMIFEDKVMKEKFNYLLNTNIVIEAENKHLSNAEILQIILEERWSLKENDMDRVVMVHELEYELDNLNYYLSSSLIIDGENPAKTAMAKCVGLPLGIAVDLFLRNKISLKGLVIPIYPELYKLILPSLEKFDITFKDHIQRIN